MHLALSHYTCSHFVAVSFPDYKVPEQHWLRTSASERWRNVSEKAMDQVRIPTFCHICTYSTLFANSTGFTSLHVGFEASPSNTSRTTGANQKRKDAKSKLRKQSGGLSSSLGPFGQFGLGVQRIS